MTECNASPIAFSSLGRRSVEARFDGGNLTSDAGALLLREADRRLGLTAALDRARMGPRIATAEDIMSGGICHACSHKRL